MKWLVRTFLGAVIAGAGWKVGAEAYEQIKKQLQKRNGHQEEEAEENGAAATQTKVVEVSDQEPTIAGR
jgi:hypothetical protein